MFLLVQQPCVQDQWGEGYAHQVLRGICLAFYPSKEQGQGAGLDTLEKREWGRGACGAGLGWASANSSHVRSTVCTPRTSDSGKSDGG